ncbi:hypothetical protein [Parafrankia discariae]|uniref:hypothetical protein n=1 Tax=Parafrankia discariae TaxID=365528 RepID=UPI00054FB0CA|nr:hypothetical protein [Parafrankia discariae]
MGSRIDELANIDLWEADGIREYCSTLAGLSRDLTRETAIGSEAIRAALATADTIFGWPKPHARMLARRTTAPLRRMVGGLETITVDAVKSGILFQVNFGDPFEARGGAKTPAKTVKF